MVIAALLSVGVHVGTGVVVLRYADGVTVGVLTLPPDAPTQTLLTLASPETPLPHPEPPKPEATPVSVRPPDPPAEPPPTPLREVTAGVDESKAITETWKGVNEAEATEHAAPKFEIDQAGFSPEAGPPMPPAEAAPVVDVSPEAPSSEESRATPQPEPVVPPPSTAETPSPNSTVEVGDQSNEATDADEAREAREATPPTEAPRPDATLPVPAEAPAQTEQEAQALVEAREAARVTDSKAAMPGQSPPPPTTLAGGTNAPAGILAPDESAARSASEPIAVKPGKPVARAGLRIQTSYARFSVSALILNKPRSPLVRITFGRDGKVKHAAFVPGQTTGSEDVDKPLLDSLYRWSAQGKDLLTIPTHDPHAGLTLTFRIVL
ncbi:MAG: hypothetical protein HBSAPP03_29770 [Phycisphaerae bacterium]|nr:MAG: hypothetical protein HBSAPP03_29770 [Phycisphaerae bacterium]